MLDIEYSVIKSDVIKSFDCKRFTIYNLPYCPELTDFIFQPSNLSIDFERFVDSSDSEFSNEDEPFMLKSKF